MKVFCHEDEAKKDFDAINDALFADSEKANRYANMLMPILNNIGNVLYVLVALIGGILLLNHAPNLSISGLAFGISIVVPFLNMTSNFRQYQPGFQPIEFRYHGPCGHKAYL